jgi:hypothetical protein
MNAMDDLHNNALRSVEDASSRGRSLIAQRRHEALEQLKEQIAVLGFSADDLCAEEQEDKCIDSREVSRSGDVPARLVRSREASGLAAG